MTQRADSLFRQTTRGLLLPVARFCVRNGIRIQEVVEELKGAFLQASREELLAKGEESNTSRLSVITGIQRKDISRILSEIPPPSSNVNLLIRIIGQWAEDQRFCSKPGSPLLITFDGAESQFAELVKAVSSDLNPYTVLFELQRTGLVSKVQNKLKLNRQSLIVDKNIGEALPILTSDTAELFEAIYENIFNPEPVRNLHLKTSFDNVALKFLPRIRDWFLDRGTEFHTEAQRFLSGFDKDLNSKLCSEAGGARIALGSFSRVSVSHPLPESTKG